MTTSALSNGVLFPILIDSGVNLIKDEQDHVEKKA